MHTLQPGFCFDLSDEPRPQAQSIAEDLYKEAAPKGINAELMCMDEFKKVAQRVAARGLD